MDQGPLVNEQIDAGTRFLAEFAKYAQIDAAFWLRASDDGVLNLYIASDEIHEKDVKLAYTEVIRIANFLRDPNFNPFQVKVIGVGEPMAQAAMAIYKQYPASLPTHFKGRFFGGTSVEEVYIYPLAQGVATK